MRRWRIANGIYDSEGLADVTAGHGGERNVILPLLSLGDLAGVVMVLSVWIPEDNGKKLFLAGTGVTENAG